MQYEHKEKEFPESGSLREDVCETALAHLLDEIAHLSEAGATARIEALCEVLRVVGGRR